MTYRLWRPLNVGATVWSLMWGRNPLCGRERGAGSGCGVQISNSGVSFQSQGLHGLKHEAILDVRTCRQSVNMDSILNNPPFHSAAAFFDLGYLANVNRLEHTPQFQVKWERWWQSEVIFKPTLWPTLSTPGLLAWHGDTYRVWQVVLGADQALDDLCPAAVAKVTGRHVVSRAVLQSVSAGHNLALDGSAHKCPQHLHCHTWHHTSKEPAMIFKYFKVIHTFIIWNMIWNW